MKDKIGILVLVSLFIVCLTVGCYFDREKEKEYGGDQDYFETNDFSITRVITSEGMGHYYILTDEETGVQYIVVNVGHGSAIYPRLDADGFVFYPGYEEEEEMY